MDLSSQQENFEKQSSSFVSWVEENSREDSSRMKEIKSRMKEKRKRREELNRSKFKRYLESNASLRANNRSLAKSLEEALCESQQNKKMILELQSERLVLLEKLGRARELELDRQKQMSEVKRVSNRISGNLIDTTVLLAQMAEICSLPRDSKASSIMLSRPSEGASDEDILTDQMYLRPNIYNKSGSEVNVQDDEERPEQPPRYSSRLTAEIESLETPFLFVDEPLPDATPKRGSRSSQFVSEKNSRKMSNTFCKDASTDNKSKEESEESPKGNNELKTRGKSGTRVSFLEDVALADSDEKLSSSSFSQSPSLPQGQRGLQAQKGHVNEVLASTTILGEMDMELTATLNYAIEEAALPLSCPIDESKKISEKLSSKSSSKKSHIPLQKSRFHKGIKISSKNKQGSKLKKATKVDQDLPVPHVSNFDLSLGESFSQPSPQHFKGRETPREEISTGDNKSPTTSLSSCEASTDEKQNEVSAKISKEEEGVSALESENETVTKIKRRSRKSQSKSKTKDANKQTETQIIIEGENNQESSPMTRKSLKPLSEVLNNTLCKMDTGSSTTDSNIFMKPTLHKKTGKSKQKKKLYNSKLSLEKELPVVRKKSESGENIAGSGNKTGEMEGKGDYVDEAMLQDVLNESWMKEFLEESEEKAAPSRRSKSKKHSSKPSAIQNKNSLRRDTFVVGVEERPSEIDSQSNGPSDNKKADDRRRGTIVVKRAADILEAFKNEVVENKEVLISDFVEDVRSAKFIPFDNPKKGKKIGVKNSSQKSTSVVDDDSEKITKSEPMKGTEEVVKECKSARKRKSEERRASHKKQKLDSNDLHPGDSKVNDNLNESWLDHGNLELVHGDDDSNQDGLPEIEEKKHQSDSPKNPRGKDRESFKAAKKSKKGRKEKKTEMKEKVQQNSTKSDSKEVEEKKDDVDLEIECDAPLLFCETTNTHISSKPLADVQNCLSNLSRKSDLAKLVTKKKSKQCKHPPKLINTEVDPLDQGDNVTTEGVSSNFLDKKYEEKAHSRKTNSVGRKLLKGEDTQNPAGDKENIPCGYELVVAEDAEAFRPRRRKALVNYKEPSTTSKLRQGDIFFKKGTA